MEEKELVPIRFFLSKEEKLEFRKICLEENTTMKDKVREIVCDYVENQKEEKKKDKNRRDIEQQDNEERVDSGESTWRRRR